MGLISKIRNLFIQKTSLVGGTLDVNDVAIAKKNLRSVSKIQNKQLIDEFEKKFTDWNGSLIAKSFISGRSALSAAIEALGITINDEVILPAYTCVVVPNAFKYVGAKIIYCDIELDTFGLEFESFKRKVTPQTKAVLVHHLFGIVSRDLEKIVEFSKRNGILVIEDCAHSLGATLKDIKVGNFGNVGFYSFEISKVMTTFCGGMVVTNDKILAEKINEIHEKLNFPDNKKISLILKNIIYVYYRNRSKLKYNLIRIFRKENILKTTTIEELQGVKPKNYFLRMPSQLAEIGLNQLSKLDNINKNRRSNTKKWEHLIIESGYRVPLIIEGSVPVYLRYSFLGTHEMKINHNWAKNYKVDVGVWFSGKHHPIDIPIDDCPNADKAVECMVNLPTLFK